MVYSVYSSGIQSMTLEAYLQELKAASHITSTVKGRQKLMHTCLVVLSPFSTLIQSRIPFLGNGDAQNGLGLPASINL